MEYLQLRNFVTVAQTRSFKQAANVLFVTRQAVSQSILQLEEELGYPLFARCGGQLVLTAQAERFLPRAQHIVELMQTLSHDMRCAAEVQATPVRVCYSITMYALYEETLQRFAHEHTGKLALSLHAETEQDCARLLKEGRYDFALTTTPIDRGSRLFAQFPLCILMSDQNPLRQKDTVCVTDLQDETFYAYGSGTGIPMYVPDCIRYTLDSDRIIVSDDLMYIFRCVQRNRGVLMAVEENIQGLLSGTAVRRFPEAGTWNHYLTCSPAVQESQIYAQVYRELIERLSRP